MNSFLRFANVALVLLVVATTTSCSNMEVAEITDPAEKSGETEQIFKKIAAGEKVTACYALAAYQLFHNDERTGDNWEEINLEDYCGWESSLPGRINIIDSQAALPYRMGNLVTGGSPLSMVWNVYCDATNIHPQLCLSVEIKVDEHENTLTIGDITCDIEVKTQTGFRVAHYSSYWYHDNSGNTQVGTSRELLVYNQETLDEETIGNIWLYPSEQDLIADLLARFRAEFGDEVNLNAYLYPNVILDNPIVNFNELEELLLAS